MVLEGDLVFSFIFIFNIQYIKIKTTKHQKVAYHSCLRLDNSALKVASIKLVAYIKTEVYFLSVI